MGQAFDDISDDKSCTESKKVFVGVTVSVSKGEPTVIFTRGLKDSLMSMWPQTDDICETETGDITAFLPEPIKSRRGDMIFPV
jgi:hypothetical protein